jgi:hypothetical protein
VSCADIIRHFRGEPTSAKSTGWRWGSHGSLSVSLDKNCWFDFEANEGGDTIRFIERELGYGKADAISWLLDSEHHSDPTATSKPSVLRPVAPLGRVVATYDYESETGALLFQVVRLDPKGFRQRRPNGQGGWVWSIQGVPQVPYRLPDLMNAAADKRTILIVEGEKDVENLLQRGIAATCNAGGAGKWGVKHSQYLRGADVVLVPDNDFSGADHMNKVGYSLRGIAASIRILELPNLQEKGDITDWLDAGHSPQELLELMAQAPKWEFRAPFLLRPPQSTLGIWVGEESKPEGQQDQETRANTQGTEEREQTNEEEESHDEQASDQEEANQKDENSRDAPKFDDSSGSTANRDSRFLEETVRQTITIRSTTVRGGVGASIRRVCQLPWNILYCLACGNSNCALVIMPAPSLRRLLRRASYYAGRTARIRLPSLSTGRKSEFTV